MHDLDLEARLRDELREAAREVAPSERLDGLVCERRRARDRHQTLGAGGLAVVGLAGVTLAASVVLGGGEDGSSLSAGSSAEVTEAAPLYLAAGAGLPEGFELLDASGPGELGDLVEIGGLPVPAEWDRWDGTQRWVRFDAAREHPVDVLDISWRVVADPDEVVGPFPNAEEMTLESGDLAIGSTFDGQLYGTVELEGDPRIVVNVSGIVAPGLLKGAPVEPLPWGVIASTFEALTPRDGGGVSLSVPPGGFELVGEWPGEASPGVNQRLVAYGVPDERGFQVQVVDDSELPPGVVLGSSAARLVTVRGNEGVSTPRRPDEPRVYPTGTEFLSGADQFVQWVEPSGERVTVLGAGMTEDEVLAVANGLEVISAAAWAELVESTGTPAEPDPGGPPEAEAEAEAEGEVAGSQPGTSVVPAGPPPEGSRHVEGSYEGTEHYALTEGDCDLDHVLDTTWELTDGSAWAFHHEYCGRIDGEVWSYAGGRWTITTPDGATLTGTAGPHSAPGPTYNVPGGPGIQLTIDGGTGSFDGATGACALMNHVTQVTLGTQRQDGTFACDIVP